MCDMPFMLRGAWLSREIKCVAPPTYVLETWHSMVHGCQGRLNALPLLLTSLELGIQWPDTLAKVKTPHPLMIQYS
jgi:hypothetical protein